MREFLAVREGCVKEKRKKKGQCKSPDGFSGYLKHYVPSGLARPPQFVGFREKTAKAAFYFHLAGSRAGRLFSSKHVSTLFVD